jgi:hypothetical protein
MKHSLPDHRGARLFGAAALALLLLAACAKSDTALFATNSSLGIDFDSKPPLASVGYDRTEGYIGPRYDDGTVPPVIASIRSNSTFLRGNAQQLYATGDAAIEVQNRPGETIPENAQGALAGDSKLMFFGTNTNVGMRVGFTQTAPDSFSFGYKRQEVSVIPLAEIEAAKDGRPAKHHYPSVLASIDTTGSGESAKKGGFNIVQFFATGSAAKKLAKNEEIKEIFDRDRKSALEAYRESAAAQNEVAVTLLSCYQAVRFQDFPKIWKDALRLKLLDSDDDLKHLVALHDEARAAQDAGDFDDREQNLRAANVTYAGLVAGSRGAQAVRATLMTVHKDLVCDLAKEGFPSN